MGLSIHYSGRFNPQTSLKEMIEEVKDIAEIYNWQYTIFDEQFPTNEFDIESYTDIIYGINFTPPDCETINLCFLSNGRMSSPAHLKFFGNSADEDYKKYLYSLSVKTQFAGINIHKLVIHLLKYLSEKYFREFEVIDEGQYWETNDDKLLEETFRRYDYLLDSVGLALENIPIEPDETFEEYFQRILKIIYGKRDR
ncbi:MAG: hypothetical protein KJ799_00460 [Bacteroidetes bacterium]|nr:hypothetical protein [Bacteroidota bacterium]MBU1680832.1 hypothetical protein [Bacteroidota bacterium]MBU2505193.1 hypothetical protein [Bacteroidota bacterium]